MVKNKNVSVFILLSVITLLVMFLVSGVSATVEVNLETASVLPGGGEAELPKRALRDESEDDGMVEILILLEMQTDTSKVASLVLQARPPDLKNATRIAVVGALQETAEQSQSSLIEYLEDKREEGKVTEIKSFFIVNTVFARVSEELVKEIGERSDVALVKPNERIQLIEPLISSELPKTSAVEWNITRVKAPQVWAQGITGTGIVVGIIDTGVYLYHEALLQQYRGYDSGGSHSHAYNWFDPYYSWFNPDDLHGHGTHVTGTVLGADPAGNNQIGVAPGAKWIAARGLDDYGSGSEANLLACGEYLLAPTPNVDGTGTPDPTKAPDIINNSWGGSSGFNEWYRLMVQSWRSSQILPVFAAGNSGPNSGTINIPANYPESFAVAAIDSSNNIASFSSRGPAPYPAPDDMQPLISAPGVNIRSSTNDGGYQGGWNGTSMAAPHIAGVAALLLHNDPGMTIDQLELAIVNTATPRTDGTYPNSPNYGYGYGLVNAFKAIFGDVEHKLAVSFNSGSWLYDPYTIHWDRFTSSTARAIAYADMTGDGYRNVIVSFPSGTWYIDAGGSWVRLTATPARALYGRYNTLLASFPSGTWEYYAPHNEWFRITSSPAHAITSSQFHPGPDNPVFSFDSGIWYTQWGTAGHEESDGVKTFSQASVEDTSTTWSWVRLTSSRASALSGIAHLLYASFPSGTWEYHGSSNVWFRITSTPAIAITNADMRNDGYYNPVFSFPSGSWFIGWDLSGAAADNADEQAVKPLADTASHWYWERFTSSTARALSSTRPWIYLVE